MKYLNIYKKLNLETEKEIFDYFIDNLNDSIFTWDYFVNFIKVKTNILKIEKELNLLNVLIGKKNIEKEFINLIKEYPKVRIVLPLLIAVRKNKLKTLKIISNYKTLIPENKLNLFDPKIKLDNNLEKELLKYFNISGLKDIFKNKNVKNIVDYCFGVEVGLDTNARKNRTGKSMEILVENILKQLNNHIKFKWISQATSKKIKNLWNLDVKIDKTNRKFDFAVFHKKQLYLIETNYYSGGGSKIKSTAGEYKQLNDFIKKQGFKLIWITDGLGWKTTLNSLKETFKYNDYIFNLKIVNNALKEIFG